MSQAPAVSSTARSQAARLYSTGREASEPETTLYGNGRIPRTGRPVAELAAEIAAPAIRRPATGQAAGVQFS